MEILSLNFMKDFKFLSLRKEQQVINLIGKSRFIEIIGPSGKGKS